MIQGRPRLDRQSQAAYRLGSKKKRRKVQEIAKGECRCIIDMVKKSIIVKKIKKTAW
jgi:hypothetical protein